MEEDGRGATDIGAEAEVGVHEGPGEKVETVEGGRGAGGRRVGERLSVGGDVLKREEGVREVVEGVTDTGGACFWDEADMRAVVGESEGQIETPYTVPCPWRAFSGGVVDHDELTGGVEGLGIEVVRGAAETVPG